MTEIESIIQLYKDGELTLDQLADRLAVHEYRPRHKVPDDPAQAYLDHLERIGLPPEEGTWEELETASSRGLLTREEYRVILERRLDRRA